MKFLILLLLFIGTAGSCDTPKEIEVITSKELNLQLDQIKDLAASKNCTENSECSYMAYGSKGCGSPQAYIVFSSEVDLDKLKHLVNPYTAAEAVYNKQNGIKSDCSLVTSPKSITCVDGNCVEMN